MSSRLLIVAIRPRPHAGGDDFLRLDLEQVRELGHRDELGGADDLGFFDRDLAVPVLATAVPAADATLIEAGERLADVLEHELLVDHLLLLAVAASHAARLGRTRGWRRVRPRGRRGTGAGRGRSRWSRWPCGRGRAGALVARALQLLLVLARLLLPDRRASPGPSRPGPCRTVSESSVLMWFFTSTPSRRTIWSTASLDMPRSLATS